MGDLLASLSWRSLLAHRSLTAKVQAVTFAIGNLVIIGFDFDFAGTPHLALEGCPWFHSLAPIV